MALASTRSNELQKMENSGNEAKKYLKTKDITFLQCANYARFARNLRPIRPLKEQESRRLAKTSCNLGVEGPCWKVTHCRLVGAVREPPLHALFTRGVAQTCRSLACLRHCPGGAYIPPKYGRLAQTSAFGGLRCPEGTRPKELLSFGVRLRCVQRSRAAGRTELHV